MIEGMLGRVAIGDKHPVRLMGIINLSQESFYQGSVATQRDVLPLAQAMQEEGADIIDLGAVSTAPGSPPVSETMERDRLFPCLKELAQNITIDISVDTQRSKIADDALSSGASCINDVSGLRDPQMARRVADHNASLIIMAGSHRSGDLLNMHKIIPRLGEQVRTASQSGVSLHKIAVDPGIGKWIPEKTPAHDLAILDGFDRLKSLRRPIVAALSRKSFIGDRLSQPDPYQRLTGSLAATAIAVYLGAHIVRTHDVSASRDTIMMAQAIRGRPAQAKDGEIDLEVLDAMGFGEDLSETFRQTGVDERGLGVLCRKGSFRILSLRGMSAMEALIIKQEMLARGGDAAIPKLALRCDPHPEEVIILGTLSQISSLAKNLREQPFRLGRMAALIEEALEQINSVEHYR